MSGMVPGSSDLHCEAGTYYGIVPSLLVIRLRAYFAFVATSWKLAARAIVSKTPNVVAKRNRRATTSGGLLSHHNDNRLSSQTGTTGATFFARRAPRFSTAVYSRELESEDQRHRRRDRCKLTEFRAREVTPSVVGSPRFLPTKQR